MGENIFNITFAPPFMVPYPPPSLSLDVFDDSRALERNGRSRLSVFQLFSRREKMPDQAKKMYSSVAKKKKKRVNLYDLRLVGWLVGW